jgi:hypothetical protein
MPYTAMPYKVLENVRQRQLQVPENVNKISSMQGIFFHLAGNFCHLINWNAI